MFGFLEKIPGIKNPEKVGKCRFWIGGRSPDGDIVNIDVPALRYTFPLTYKVQSEAELRKAVNNWLTEQGLELRDEKYVRHSIRWGSYIAGTLYYATPKAREK